MLEGPRLDEYADLARIKTMLTLVVRSERFCDGYGDAMIKEGAHSEALGAPC